MLHQLFLHPDGVDRAGVVATIGSNETTVSVLQRTVASVGGDAWHW